MTAVASNRRFQRSRPARRGRPPFLKTLLMAWQPLAVAIVVAFALYNPSGYSIWHYLGPIFFDGIGDVTGANGQEIPFYYQPAKIAMTIVLLGAAVFLYFMWQSARNEMGYVIGYAGLWILLNALIIGVSMWLFGVDLTSWKWVDWQFMPFTLSAIAYGSYMPAVRRAYNTSGTMGGGHLDDIGVVDHDYDHDGHDHH